MIFETTQAGRQPIADAHVYAEQVPDGPSAHTKSDLQGGFFLCNLPAGNTHLYVWAPGFSPGDVEWFDPSQAARLEIELKRL